MSKVKKTIIANNFLDLTEVKLVGKKHDSVGILSVIKSYFAMSESSDGFLDREEILMIAEGWGVEDPESWLSLCVEKNIFTEESGRYFNTHVQKDREKYQKKLEYDKKRKGIKNDSVRKDYGKTNDLDIDSDFDNDIDNEDLKKNSAPQIGLIKISDHVRLTDFSKDQFKMRCAQEGFNFTDRKRMVELLDRDFEKNPEKREERDHFKDLISWPLDAVKLEKAKLERARGSPKSGIQEKPNPIGTTKPIGF